MALCFCSCDISENLGGLPGRALEIAVEDDGSGLVLTAAIFNDDDRRSDALGTCPVCPFGGWILYEKRLEVVDAVR